KQPNRSPGFHLSHFCFDLLAPDQISDRSMRNPVEEIFFVLDGQLIREKYLLLIGLKKISEPFSTSDLLRIWISNFRSIFQILPVHDSDRFMLSPARRP